MCLMHCCNCYSECYNCSGWMAVCVYRGGGLGAPTKRPNLRIVCSRAVSSSQQSELHTICLNTGLSSNRPNIADAQPGSNNLLACCGLVQSFLIRAHAGCPQQSSSCSSTNPNGCRAAAQKSISISLQTQSWRLSTGANQHLKPQCLATCGVHHERVTGTVCECSTSTHIA